MDLLIHRQPQAHTGFSLVELMIALTLGSLLVLGLYSMLSSQRLTYSMTQANGSLTERTQRDSNFIKSMVNQAGYMDYTSMRDSLLGNTPFIASGSWLKGQVVRADNNLTTAGFKSGSDRLQLRFLGDGSLVFNCAGGTVPAQSLWNVSLYVDGDEQLICADANGNTVLDQGVETLQLQFSNPAAPSSQLRADQVSSSALWLTINRLSYGLLLTEAQTPTTGVLNGSSYQILDQSVSSANDSQLRQPLTESLVLRNNRS